MNILSAQNSKLLLKYVKNIATLELYFQIFVNSSRAQKIFTYKRLASNLESRISHLRRNNFFIKYYHLGVCIVQFCEIVLKSVNRNIFFLLKCIFFTKSGPLRLGLKIKYVKNFSNRSENQIFKSL